MATWHALGCSVRGASHARDGLPNQDALLLEANGRGAQAPAFAAVADGHGGARHFRSADGARLAVAAAREALFALADSFARADAAERARLAAVELPMRVVTRWVELTQRHLAEHAIADAEWATLAAAEGDDALATVRADPLLAYGATLIAALALPGCLVLTQLGDGDLVAVDAQGVCSRPVPNDERLGGNITTSICRPGAEADFRSVVLDGSAATPALLLLSTDGYANSFRSDADFLQVGADFLGLLRQHGAAAVEKQLGGILEHASTHGSGDDITLAMLVVPPSAVAVPVVDRPGGMLATPAAVTPSALVAIERRMSRQQQWIVALVAALLVVLAWTQRERFSAAFHRPAPAAHEPVGTPTPPSNKPPAADSGLAGDEPASAVQASPAASALQAAQAPGLSASEVPAIASAASRKASAAKPGKGK